MKDKVARRDKVCKLLSQLFSFTLFMGAKTKLLLLTMIARWKKKSCCIIVAHLYSFDESIGLDKASRPGSWT